jgi:hypothetical protein
MFATKEVPKDYANEVYDSLVRQGVISPALISTYQYEDWQLTSLRNNYKLSKKNVAELIDGIKTDARSQTFDNETKLDVNIMTEHAKLSHRIGFWMQLKKLHVFVHAKEAKKDSKELELEERIKHVFLVDKDYKDKLPEWMKKLTPVPQPDLETLRCQVRLSNETEHGLMYNYSDIPTTNDHKYMEDVENLIKSKAIKHDWIGQINGNVLRRIGYLDTFDGVTTTDIVDFFEIDPIAAAWIIDLLTENGVLKRDTTEMHRFTRNDQLWKDKVEIYIDKEVKHDANLIAKHADSLTKIRNLPMLKNVTTGIINHFCEIADNDKLLTFYKLLKDEKLLEPMFFTKFRLYGKLDCSCLPSCIANEVDEFLSDRFAYSFALEHLCAALDNSINAPTTAKKLFLQENPQDEFYKELLSSGIGLQSRISQQDYLFLKEVDLDQYKYKDELETVINNHRTKLWDQTHYHMEFVPFSTYFAAQGYTIDSDTKAIIENGLSMVISKRDESIGWWLQNTVIKSVATFGKAIWSGVSAVGNWFYSIGSCICKFVSPFIDGCVDAFDYVVESGIAAVRTIKEQVVAVVDAIADSEIVKMATQTVKDVASAVGEQIANVAEAVGDVMITVADKTGITTAAKAVGNAAVTARDAVVTAAVTVGDAAAEGAAAVRDVVVKAAAAVGDVAVAAGEYIADTKAFKVAKEAFNTAMNAAKNVYQKMSTYVTATTESYLYYNQCRFTARRLAIEQRNIVDEHFIIQNYDKALSQENRVRANDGMFEQVNSCFFLNYNTHHSLFLENA